MIVVVNYTIGNTREIMFDIVTCLMEVGVILTDRGGIFL